MMSHMKVAGRGVSFHFICLFVIVYLCIRFRSRAIQVMDFDYALLNGELDLNKFMDMSVEIFAVELIHRILVSLYEVSSDLKE